MKIAIADASHLRLPARPHQTEETSTCRSSAVATKGTGVVVGAPALAAFSVIIATWCLVGAALVMGASGGGQADSGVPNRGRKC